MIEHWLDGDFILDEVLPVNGSPSRFVERRLVRNVRDGNAFVLEGVEPAAARSRIEQAAHLEALAAEDNACIVPWLRTRSCDSGVMENGLFWQCRRYVPCIELPRETYALDLWRGRAAALWLKGIHRHEAHGNVFFITDYISRLMTVLAQKSRALHGDLTDVLGALDFTREEEAALPVVFSHGDFHPGNILWGDGCINAVIDWEFCGLKPICYDAANLLGCLGVDNPDWLSSPMAKGFLDEYHLPEVSDEFLLKYIVALRFAWMREWWNAGDMEMVIQELDFMWIVISML